MKIKEYLYNI